MWNIYLRSFWNSVCRHSIDSADIFIVQRDIFLLSTLLYIMYNILFMWKKDLIIFQ